MENTFNKALERIRNINYDSDKAFEISGNESSGLLVSEFLRRGNTFRDLYDNKESRYPIFSAADVINEKIPEEITELIETSMSEGLLKYSWTTQYVCKWYLEWMYLNSIRVEMALLYADLYEPMIRLYERGGGVGFHHAEFTCGRFAWSKNFSSLNGECYLDDFSDENLNEIDIIYLDKSTKKYKQNANEQFLKLWVLIDSMQDDQTKNFLFENRDKNIRDILIHLYEWHKLFLIWINKDVKSSEKSIYPDAYNRSTENDMNMKFWKKHQKTSYLKAINMLKKSHEDVVNSRSGFSIEEQRLFYLGTIHHYERAMKKIEKHIETLKSQKNK